MVQKSFAKRFSSLLIEVTLYWVFDMLSDKKEETRKSICFVSIALLYFCSECSTFMNLDSDFSIMQVWIVVLWYVKDTMLKAKASGTARMIDSTQMTTISTAVSKGMPTPWTRLQEATALYL